ncbi:hypothetical protein [Leisingera aquaemixtae]|uniref:Uncharacterized protein n=1 Tax=Leisingera aquaemixtae TaxID=1396826 RepID=A0A0P1HDU3_9RHOB|nr:hypothetical protein [Leisingera aquaemixtae]CUI01873.1 hypothetical protein PHA8399_04022 [Leisingera aquaemixtae]
MSSKSRGSAGSVKDMQVLQHEPKPGLSLIDIALLAILIANLILVPLALFAMSEESGPTAAVKNLVVGAAAAGAAFGVNRFALDRLAPLHAIGFRLAGVVAVVAILITGAGTALGSFTGLTYKSVEAKTYSEAGQDMTAYIGAVNEVALVATRIVPSVETIAENIDQTASCESRSSCLSGRGNGGRGPMSRALETAAAQAFSIAQALQVGELEREQLLEDLNDLNAAYFEVLSESGKPVSDRRAELQAIHSEIRQVASALTEVMPLGVVQGYAGDLRAGSTLPGNPSGTRILNGFLHGHAETLSAQLDDLPDVELVAPDFPQRPGMTDVLGFIPAFLAIAAIVVVGELVLPLTLYLMTFTSIAWELEKLRGRQKQEVEEDTLSKLLKPRRTEDPDDGAGS